MLVVVLAVLVVLAFVCSLAVTAVVGHLYKVLDRS